jgi:hypothetical protein
MRICMPMFAKWVVRVCEKKNHALISPTQHTYERANVTKSTDKLYTVWLRFGLGSLCRMMVVGALNRVATRRNSPDTEGPPLNLSIIVNHPWPWPWPWPWPFYFKTLFFFDHQIRKSPAFFFGTWSELDTHRLDRQSLLRMISVPQVLEAILLSLCFAAHTWLHSISSRNCLVSLILICIDFNRVLCTPTSHCWSWRNFLMSILPQLLAVSAAAAALIGVAATYTVGAIYKAVNKQWVRRTVKHNRKWSRNDFTMNVHGVLVQSLFTI